MASLVFLFSSLLNVYFNAFLWLVSFRDEGDWDLGLKDLDARFLNINDTLMMSLRYRYDTNRRRRIGEGVSR